MKDDSPQGPIWNSNSWYTRITGLIQTDMAQTWLLKLPTWNPRKLDIHGNLGAAELLEHSESRCRTEIPWWINLWTSPLEFGSYWNRPMSQASNWTKLSYVFLASKPAVFSMLRSHFVYGSKRSSHGSLQQDPWRGVPWSWSCLPSPFSTCGCSDFASPSPVLLDWS